VLCVAGRGQAGPGAARGGADGRVEETPARRAQISP
jgi:hypothetical protein